MCAHKLLEDLRYKLLARLDSLSKKRGQFQDINAFIEFRNASGVPQGDPVDLICFERALRQFDVTGSSNAALAKKAFSILTKKDSRDRTNDTAITFNHFKEWCSVRDANVLMKQKKKHGIGGVPTSPTPRTARSNTFRQQKEGDILLTGRSLTNNPSGGATNRSNRLNRSNRSDRSDRSSRNNTARKNKTNIDPFVMIDGNKLLLSNVYIMLKTKIIGKHPGGSHGLLRCWKQFRSMAGSGRGGDGGKGAGIVTKAELKVCFRNYGLPLDKTSDLDLIFDKFDVNQDGVIDLNDWLEELFGKWSSSVNTFGDDSREIYEGLVYKPMEYLDIPVSEVFKMLKEKIAMRMKGTSYPARRGWNQFRTMSGGHPEGVNKADLEQALRYYGMPVNEKTLNTVFAKMDVNTNGLIKYSEFRETVLEDWVDERFGDYDMDEGDGAKKEDEHLNEGKKEEEEISYQGGMLSLMETGRSRKSSSRSRKSNKEVLRPGAMHASVQEKVRAK